MTTEEVRQREEKRHKLDALIFDPDSHIKMANDPSLITSIIPEMADCVGLDQQSVWHDRTVFQHSLDAFAQISINDYQLRIATLLHDIGKPRCMVIGEDGHGHFHGHGGISADIVQTALDGMGLLATETSHIVKLIRYHDVRVKETDEAVLDLAAKLGGPAQFERFLLLRTADIMAQAPKDRQSRLDKVARLRARYAVLPHIWPSITEELDALKKGDREAV